MKKSINDFLSIFEKSKEGFKINLGRAFLQIVAGVILLFLGVYHWVFGVIFIAYIFTIVIVNIRGQLNYLKTLANKGSRANKITFENKKPFREMEVKLSK